MTFIPAMIMAAGLATRLRPFTEECAKAFLPVLGAPLVQYGLESLQAAGVSKAVINVHCQAAQTQRQIQDLIVQPELSSLRLLVSDESSCLLEGAGGIAHALPLLESERFFLTNADMISTINWKALLEQHQRLHAEYGVLVTLGLLEKSPSFQAYSEIEFDPSSFLIQRIGDKRSDRPFFMSAAVFEARAFHGISGKEPADLLSQVLWPAIHQKKAGAFLSSGLWLDIASPELWWLTHFELMRLLEENPEVLLPPWRRRLETQVQRMEDLKRTEGFLTPSFWAPLSPQDRLPLPMGPFSILYGSIPSDQSSLQNGIGWKGHWVKVKMGEINKQHRSID